MHNSTIIVRFKGKTLGQCLRIAGEELRQKALTLGCDLTAFINASGSGHDYRDEHNVRLVALTRQYAVYDII